MTRKLQMSSCLRLNYKSELQELTDQAVQNRHTRESQLCSLVSNDLKKSPLSVEHRKDFKQPKLTKYKDADEDPFLHLQEFVSNCGRIHTTFPSLDEEKLCDGSLNFYPNPLTPGLSFVEKKHIIASNFMKLAPSLTFHRRTGSHLTSLSNGSANCV